MVMITCQDLGPINVRLDYNELIFISRGGEVWNEVVLSSLGAMPRFFVFCETFVVGET